MYKKNKKPIFFLIFFLAVLIFPDHSLAQKHKFLPPKGKALFFIGQDIKNIDEYIKSTDSVPAGFSMYTSIQQAQGITAPFNNGAGTQYFDHIVKKYPDMIVHMAIYMVDALQGVIDGEYDNNIQKIISWIKEVKRPVYLRIGYEFDFPKNRYDPELYKMVFKYIVDKFRQERVSNVAFVWHSCAAYGSRSALKWYPGDEYVDWFAISYFHAYNKIEPKYIADLAKEHNKPFMIAESAPAKVGTLKGELSWRIFFDRYFKFIEENNVRIFCYINCDWDGFSQFVDDKWGDSRVQQNPFVLEKWNKELKKNKYLLSSKTLFKRIGFVSK